MKISKQARRDAKELFRSCLTNGLLDETKVQQAVQQVIQRKPRGYFNILSHFQRLVKLDVARRTARVESAVALPESLQASVRANLNRIYGAGLSISFSERPALIGGMRVQVGSDVYDGSVQARLAGLTEGL
ncbi:MAG: F0F1 ATP synthase subunit delta [Verrucomicrobia bacterium]|nr:F0F1 ATP synthase subunit delta [Verrucomicrobiota bacterium]